MKSIFFQSQPVEGTEVFKANSNFELCIWKPKGPSKSRGIVILVNGFLEGMEKGEKMLPERYRALIKELNRLRYVVTLMPLPFHFQRSNDPCFDGKYAPIERLKVNGCFLFEGGYTQMELDIEKLIKMIKNNPSSFGLQSEFETHLLGYSIGGAVALGLFMNKKYASNFDSISILLSSYQLSKISPSCFDSSIFSRYGFDSAEWLRVLKDLEENKLRFSDEFRFLIWGDNPEKFIQSLQTNNKARLLFLNGTMDELFDQDMIKSRNDDLFSLLVSEVNNLGRRQKNRQVTFIMTPTVHDFRKNAGVVAGYVGSFIANEGSWSTKS